MFGSSVKILIVDDNETDVEIVNGMLTKATFQKVVSVVSNGEEALDLLCHKGKYTDPKKYPMPDIILLDVMMPKMNGYIFVKKVKEIPAAAKIPIIVFTTVKGIQDSFKIEGVEDYVIKSLDGTELLQKINKYL
jgi:two-component system, response regulator